jgi:thiamine pyrophosphokinase
MLAVVVAAGEFEPEDEGWLSRAQLIVAADGGAVWVDGLGRHVDRLVGDLDSIDPALVERLMGAGTTVDRHPADKEASDAELAIAAAIAAGATEIVVLGAFGGPRLDHELANVLLLADADLAGRDLRLRRGPASVRCLRGPGRADLDGAVGDLVTLLPVHGDALGVTTVGLRWPLGDSTLRLGRSRGLSNEVVAVAASVEVRAGTLLIIERPPQGGMTA